MKKGVLFLCPDTVMLIREREEKIMKKQKLGLALTAVLLLTGCGGIEKMTETTVTVDDSGTVEELLLEDFSDGVWNKGKQ